MREEFIMKKEKLSRRFTIILTLIFMCFVVLTGCQQSTSNDTKQPQSRNTNEQNEGVKTEGDVEHSDKEVSKSTALEVRFGYDGEPFILHLYDNETADKIAMEVGTADWNLPINHYDDFEDADVLQFYDIPASYEIPSNPETITSEKAGEVYYSHPNRMILFYQDAEVTGEYTKVGYIEYTDAFYEAVINNPVLEGWDTKIVSVSPVD